LTVRLRLALFIVTLGTLVGLVAATGPAFAQQVDAPPRFTSAVDVVSVTAVVRDRRGRLVRDLEPRDFTVMEAGEPRPLLDVRLETDGPVRIALLLDVSGSMRMASRVVDAHLAARQVFSALGPHDEAALYVFDTQVERVLDFTSDVARLTAALEHVVPPFGQTSLYDAVARTAQEIAGEPGATRGAGSMSRRLAVVVLTDGIDTSSRLTPVEVSGVASGIDVPVYVLAVMPSVDDPRHSPAGRAAQAASELGNLSRWTGGELLTASVPAHANVAARRIVDELRHQYVLAFEASSQPGWRPVEIRARNRGHVVRTRAGYIGGRAGVGLGTAGTRGDSAREKRERRRTR
jgi:VWFA-related protein